MFAHPSKAKLVKTIHALLIAALLAVTGKAVARDNPYDLLSQVLMPFAQVLAEKAKGGNRALTLRAHLEQMTDMPPEFAGVTVDLALQAPNKLRLEAPVLGERLTICRRGQEIWVYPREKLKAVIAAAGKDKQLPPPDKSYELAPFRLPIPEKQLVFLPVLFQAKHAGMQTVGDKPCQVLDLQLMPELARALESEESQRWSARLWVDAEQKPARLVVQRPGWSITLRFEEVTFAPSLPKSTWRPNAKEAGDVMTIEPWRYDQLLRGMVGAGRKTEPKTSEATEP